MRYAVILAGGSGTRLWPASRRARPKQLLALGPDAEPMIAAAVRLGRAIAGDRVVIVTADGQAEATRVVVPDVELIVEPVGRNTAAAIGLAAALLAARDPDAVLAVLPADQHVADKLGLARVLGAALAAAEESDAIATIGIAPTRPETGFGYLEVGQLSGEVAVPVVKFVEKPDRARAEQYVASGRYLWNAGIFCATARRLLAELDTHLPDTGRAVRAIASDVSNAAQKPQDAMRARARAKELYETLPSISLDHAVMENATGVVALPAAVGWDDVGSWAALPAVRGSDAAGNTIVGAALVVDGTGNIVVSDDATLVATVGVSDLVVVKAGDAIVVIPRAQAQDVRKVIEALSARGLARYL